MRFLKGHGTGNDFVLLPDPDGDLDLTPELVRALCDRRRGIGADGVLRVVLAAVADPAAATTARWFMDYRNADGSIAEMCGNGVRVFARYLVDAGYATAGRLPIATRDGIKNADVPAIGDVTVGMGLAVLDPDGHGPAKVVVDGRVLAGDVVSTGNLHIVCRVADLADAGELRTAPVIDADRFPDGANIEFYHSAGPRHVAMRVHERGSGETLSCGTGACAVAAVAAVAAGTLPAVPGPVGVPQSPGRYTVDVPGGRLQVGFAPDGVTLAGPALIVAEGRLGDAWLLAQS